MSIARTKYKVTKSLLLLGMLTTGLLSAFIGLVAYFGQNMGTFVISGTPEASQVGITLSDSYKFTSPSSRLLVNPARSSDLTTFDMLDFAGAVSKDGDYDSTEDNNYIAYTFYLKNEGNFAVDVGFDIEITAATNGVDEVMRVMFLEDAYTDSLGNITFSSGYLYFKDINNVNENAYTHMSDQNKEIYNMVNKYAFSTKYITSEYKIQNFRPTEVKKYTLFIWLEGWDLDSGDNVSKGQLKMKLTFSIIKIIE